MTSDGHSFLRITLLNKYRAVSAAWDKSVVRRRPMDRENWSTGARD